MSDKKHILVVEDDQSTLDCYEMVLERRGYGVVTCHDAQEALDRASAEPFIYDLMLTDRSMPGMLGSELARQMRANGRMQPVIMLTGWSDCPHEERRSIDHIFVKPVEMDALLEKIKELLEAVIPL